MAFQRNSDMGMVWTSLPVASSRVASSLNSRRRSHSAWGSVRKMEKGRAGYTRTRGGTVFRSFSRSSMRSFSEDIRILHKGGDGESEPSHTARRMVLQKVVLVGLEQGTLDA